MNDQDRARIHIAIATTFGDLMRDPALKHLTAEQIAAEVMTVVRMEIEARDIRLPTKGITVARRFADYRASIDGSDGKQWGCGKTIDEAVGNVVRDHPDKIGVAITLPKALL
jgi:hypothetical protein